MVDPARLTTRHRSRLRAVSSTSRHDIPFLIQADIVFVCDGASIHTTFCAHFWLRDTASNLLTGIFAYLSAGCVSRFSVYFNQ